MISLASSGTVKFKPCTLDSRVRIEVSFLLGE